MDNKSKENTTSTADNVEENIVANKSLSNARTRQNTTTDNAMWNAARLLTNQETRHNAKRIFSCATQKEQSDDDDDDNKEGDDDKEASKDNLKDDNESKLWVLRWNSDEQANDTDHDREMDNRESSQRVCTAKPLSMMSYSYMDKVTLLHWMCRS